jgi:tRNA(Ile)-lysidine synthase
VLADLNDKVAASLTRYNMLSPGDKVGVAVSGGADSVTLLHILHHLAAYELVVLHVNHRLRGAESDADESFVRELTEQLGLPVEVRHAPRGEGNMEQLARDARRAFFAEARERLGLRYVALGHSQTDQAETILYRFLRGSGLAGLAGMSPVTADGLIRPMLQLTREEIREWAADQKIAWREDSSNQNTDLVRNRLRLELINPQLVRVLTGMGEVARDEEDWWAGRTASLYGATVRRAALGLLFGVADLRALHPAEQRRLIRHAIRNVKGDLRSIDLAHVDAIRKLLESDAGHDRVLVPGIDALRSFGTLLLAKPGKLAAEPRHYRVTIKIGIELALPYDGGRLYVKRMKPEDRFCGNFGVEGQSAHDIADLDEEVLEQGRPLDSLCVRNWEPGDEYLRTGHGKSEKIKSLFQEYRILLWERRRWPVLVMDDEIVWSRRFGAAAKFQATGESRGMVRVFYSANDGLTPV